MSELIKKTKGDLIYYTSPLLDEYKQVSHAFFTRAGGVSEGEYSSLNFRFASNDSRENVQTNHELAARTVIGAKPEDIVCTLQKHTDNIRVFKGKRGSFDSTEPVDALITDIKALCLTAYFADCQPIMFYDRTKNVCALVHAGWRGVANKIALKTLGKMHEIWNCDTADIVAVMGPAICADCFETDEDVPQMLIGSYGEGISKYIFKVRQKWHIDLKGITYRGLISCGLQDKNIEISRICPSCATESGLWWSQRKDGEERGVQGAMIMLR